MSYIKKGDLIKIVGIAIIVILIAVVLVLQWVLHVQTWLPEGGEGVYPTPLSWVGGLILVAIAAYVLYRVRRLQE